MPLPTYVSSVSYSFYSLLQVWPRREGGALPGQGEAVELLVRRPEGRGQRPLAVARHEPTAPRLPPHVVAAVRQIRAAPAAEGLRGRSLQQRLRGGEQ